MKNLICISIIFLVFTTYGQTVKKIETIDTPNTVGSISYNEINKIGGVQVEMIYQNCKQILINNPSASDGVYTIDTDGDGSVEAFNCYCDMTTDGGGWTLVAKVAGDNSTWYYDEAIYTNTTLLNEMDVSLVSLDMKNQGFIYIPVTDVRFDLGIINNYIIENLNSTNSLNTIFNDGYLATTHTRNEFISWFENGGGTGTFDNQPFCNSGGFNYSPNTDAKCRYGMVFNNENNCITSDSAIGFGIIGSSNTYPRSAGASCTVICDANINLNGWIWVR